MIKAIIVDDEGKGRETLSALVEKYCPSVQVTDKCDSVESALCSIEKDMPHVVFLDIEMPFNNGFSLLEKISKPSFDVIFITAYDHYALKAIKYSAVDYLLKPIDVEELVGAVAKVEKRRMERVSPVIDYELLLASLRLKSKSARIAVPSFDGLQMLNAEDIVKCVADESYTQITLINAPKLMVSKILKEYEELLSDHNFFRVHNSCLINLRHVTKYIKGDGGYVLMADGETVEVSRRKKNELLNKLTMIQL